MALIPTIKPDDWPGLNRAVRKLGSLKLGPTAEPAFAGLTLSGLTASRLIQTDADKKLASVSDLTSWIAGTANEINVAGDGGTVTIGIVNPLIVAKGGIGTDTLTNHGILLGSGTGAITPLGVAVNGQIPIGSVGANPVLATITGTSNQVVVTNAAGSITLSTPQDIHTEASPTFVSPRVTNIMSSVDGSRYINLSTPDSIWFRIGDESDDNYIVFKSTDHSIVSPQIYPSANNEGQLGISTNYWNKSHITNMYATSIIIGANTLDTTEWAYLDGINQALKTTDSPSFAELTINKAKDYLITGNAEQLIIQNSASDYNTDLWLYTTDGDTTDDLTIRLFGLGLPDNYANSEQLITGYTAATDFYIRSLKSGTGTARPLILYTETNTNQLYLDTDGQVGIGKVPTVELDVSGAITASGTVKATDLDVPTKGTATMVVAPSGATAIQKAMADYVCDGVADEVQINAAIVAAAAAGGRGSGSVGVGGEVVLLDGSYVLAAQIDMLTRVSLIGNGNLQNVRISNGDNCGHGIYYKAWDAAASPIGVNERGQFTIKNIVINLSTTQSAASWCIYIDNDGTETIYDCVFQNIYCGQAKTGGMYVKDEWASHYDNCTFETGSGGDGPGFQSDGGSGSVFNGCYFAHNVGHGCYFAGSGGSHYFSGCCFHDNGDAGDASHGLYINNASFNNIFVVNCKASDNWGSGFYINQGTKAIFTNCIAYRNNWSEAWAMAGFRIGGSSVKYCGLVNCISTHNDGANADTEDHDGCGYYIVGGYITLVGCQSGYNENGVALQNTSHPQVYVDVAFTGGDTNEYKQIGGLQNSIGRHFQDVFRDVATLDADGILTATAGTGAAQTITSFDGQMAVPRNVTVLCTNNASPTGNVLIQGVTADGKVYDTTLCDEVIAITAGGTTQGNIAWSRITKITIPAGVAAGDNISVGWGDKLGLSNMIRATSDVYKITFNNGYNLLTDYTISATYGTILPDAAINANDDFVIYYKGF